MLKEHENNRFTKQKDEVEAYLMRIIQRYFDIENNFSKESIEAMIIESLTRFKQIIISEKGFIFSLNKQTGHITLTIRDFGGEQAFSKNSAFNKDFGTEADTICEGNDERLYDDREPLEHVHEIADVKGLKEKLEEIGVPSGMHIHNNKSVLDMLRYTGSQTQIDLIVIEYLQKSMQDYYENLQTYKRETDQAYNKCMKDLDAYIPLLDQMLTNIQDLVNDAIKWLQDAYDYTDRRVGTFKINTLQQLLKYMTKDQVQELMDFFKKPYFIVADGEIPINDGEISFIPVEDISEAASGQGDSLKRIYDEGLRLGDDDWQWDDTNQSFVYQHNEEHSYPMFASLSKYSTYTHRVTLASASADNDCISVVIAYDDISGNHLSVLIGNGGVNASGLSGAIASVVLNYTGNYGMTGDLTVNSVQIGSGKPWLDTTEGITVLVKRLENNIKIWILYDEPHGWQPEEIDGVKSIYPTEVPTFDFNLTDYPELAVFVDKECNYGYGCFSQPLSTYKDVYFINAYSEPYGHTNITESKTTQFKVPASTMNVVNNGKMKLFFRYEKDGQTITTPLPFNFTDTNGNHTVIQGTFTEAGDIIIKSNFMNQVQLYADSNNLYTTDTIIAASCAKPNVITKIKELLKSDKCMLALVDSSTKNNFIKNLLLPNKEYYIQGYCFTPEGMTFYQDDGVTPLIYTDWDINEPNPPGLSSYIKYNTNKKWADADGLAEKIGYVAEYHIQRLSQHFSNPRIYYQVLGNKEVV